jgi:hypothetical protein
MTDATKKKYLRSTDPSDLLQVIKINPLSISYFRISVSGRTKKVRAGHLKKSTSSGLVLLEITSSYKGETLSSCVYAASTKNLGTLAQSIEDRKEGFDEIINACGDAMHLTFLQCSDVLAIKLAEQLRSSVRRNLRYLAKLSKIS